MGKIVFGRTSVPLTVDIVDERRQELAYNLLHHMMENRASVTVDGKELAPDAEQLWLVRGSERIKPGPDAEFDTPSDEKRYSTACMSNNGVIVYFAPLASYDKVNDMNNFMLTGLDGGVSIACMQNGAMERIVNNGRPVHEGMVDENGCLCTERSNRNWAKEKSPEQDFADAVMNISNGGPQMDR